jgi:thiamine-phosphate pyrophosphorylase
VTPATRPDPATAAAAGRAARGVRTPSGVVVVTDRRQAVAPLLEQVVAAVAGGARWVLLREKDLPTRERAALADRLREALAPYGARLIVAGPDPLGGDAVHLAGADPVPALDEGVLVGRSCHGPADLDRLTVEHYVTVSPVFASASKPGYGPPLGPDGLAGLCRRTHRPVLALGGVETPQRAAACVAAGAVGVAVMGAVMRASDPAAVVAGLCRAVEGIGPDSEGRPA